MSLLLDALKKAADEKKASQGDQREQPADLNTSQETPRESETPADIDPPATARTANPNESAPSTELELSLDDEPDELSPGELTYEQADAQQAEELELDEQSLANIEQPQLDQENSLGDQPDETTTAGSRADDLEMTPVPGADRVDGTVSDEALSMLIYNTNRDIRKNRLVTVSSLLIAAVLIILTGGFFFYTDMQAEIASLERRHETAMLAMKAKTSDEEVPQKSEIIRNLVSDNKLEEKVEFAREHMKAEKAQPAASGNSQKVAAKAETKAGSPVTNQEMTISRAEKVDPVEQQLDRAWLAYDNGEYDRSREIYSNVLQREPANRDALLGLGAIAVVKGEQAAAVDAYAKLLELDPGDPIANAALSNLRADQADSKELERYLVGTLEKNPASAPLNFATGNFFARQKRWSEAQQYYFNAWQSDAENPDYLYNLAVSLDQLGKSTQALQFYRDSLRYADSGQASFSRQTVEQRITSLSGQ